MPDLYMCNYILENPVYVDNPKFTHRYVKINEKNTINYFKKEKENWEDEIKGFLGNDKQYICGIYLMDDSKETVNHAKRFLRKITLIIFNRLSELTNKKLTNKKIRFIKRNFDVLNPTWIAIEIKYELI